jgi:hypothetical protein
MVALQMVDMVQLTMRGGVLSLKQPMEVRSTESIFDLIAGLKRFLSSENAERVVFALKNQDIEIRTELTEKNLRWMARSTYGEESFLFSFETQVLMVNNQRSEPRMLTVFAKKLEQLVVDLQNDRVRVFIKAKRG